MDIITKFEALLESGQDNTLLRYSLGNEYVKNKQFDLALKHLQQAVIFDPDYSAAWKLMGKAMTELDRPQQAIEAYIKGMAAAEKKGDKQAYKEMNVFLKRLQKINA